jgi:flagellar hook-associated protein 1 FlgK
MLQRYFVTIAATSSSGVYNAGESYVQAQLYASIAAPTTNVDVATSTTVANSSTATAAVGFVSFDLRDAYAVSLAGKGALVVSATNGAGVALKNTTDGTYGAASSVTLLTAVSNFASGTVTVARPTAMANKGFSTTVTISWNGAVVGTKSFTFQGEVASLVVTPRRIGATKQTISNTDAFRVSYADSAGNTLIGASLGTTAVVAATTTSVVTGASIPSGSEATTTDPAKGTLTCAAGASDYLLAGGTAQLQLQHVNPISGTTVKSNVWTATCQGSAYTYTASYDKTTYTPGSVATLTITFKDRDGDLANGYDTVGTTADLISIVGGPSETAVTIPANGDLATSGTGLAGIKTFQFIVGSTEGDFQAVVSAPVVNTRNSSQANQTVQYSVKSASTAVSNADVLKSIVALIASINKQIQALQALILKKK